MRTSDARQETDLTPLLWVGYLFFVVYGSLIPFDFKALPFDRAWAQFLKTPMLALGVESRADWIANGVLYVPIGFLTAHLLLQQSRAHRMVALVVSILFSSALALSVEFSQLYFPSRTVSLNDLLAEFVGAVLGVFLALQHSDWMKNLLKIRIIDPRRFVLHAVEAYLFAYVAFSLFPFDVLLSSAELGKKLQSDGWGWILAGAAHGDALVPLKVFSEFLLTLPFGLYLAYRRSLRPVSALQAALLGLLLGSFIEIAQLFTATGVSQGLSILTRTAGVACGHYLWRHSTNASPGAFAAFIRRHALLLILPYFLTLLFANGWFTYRWRGLEHATAALENLHFLPFYYHYFTSEARALFSLASVCFMYFPIGILIWALRGSQGFAFLVAGLLSVIVEAGKLFLLGSHPDPTNVLLAGMAAWAAIRLAHVVEQAVEHSPAPSSVNAAAAIPHAVDPTSVGNGFSGVAAIAVLPLFAFCLWRAISFPVWPVWLGLLLAASGAIVWRRPAMALLIIPLTLPILDFAPWSGRFYLDEFDLLTALCLGVGFARTRPMTGHRMTDPGGAMVLVLIAASIVLSTLRGLLPWQAPDVNSFVSYLSPFNALRIGKGALWAFLTIALARRLANDGQDVFRNLSFGLIGGLALTVSVLFWERFAFAHLLDFSTDYRVTGPISAMHTGGAYIECLLAVATPFLLQALFQARSHLLRFLGLLLLLATTYALMVTYSRNGYAAFAVALVVFLFFSARRLNRNWSSGWRHVAVAGLLLAIIFAVAVPVFTGDFAQRRIAHVGQDLNVRERHWQETMSIRPDGLASLLLGAGLGRYPQSRYLFASDRGRTGTFALMEEKNNTFLRLASGDPVYVEQLVLIRPGQTYELQLKARVAAPIEMISMSLCEKWMLTSLNCLWKDIPVKSSGDAWSTIRIPVATGTLGSSPWYAPKTVKLTFTTPRGGPRHFDIDDLRLLNTAGQNLLRNGDFSKGMDHWFFSTDNHLQWHIKSMPIAVLFEQGWLGLIAFCLFAIVAVSRAARSAWQSDLSAATALAAFSAFLVVGLFDTLIDAPRFLLLFLLLGTLCISRRLTDSINGPNGG